MKLVNFQYVLVAIAFFQFSFGHHYILYGIENCDNQTQYLYRIFVESKFVGEVQQFRGHAVLSEDLTTEIKYHIKVFKYRGDKEVQIINLKNKNACGALVEYGSTAYMDVAKSSNVPNPGSCPVPKNTYTMTNWISLDVDAIPLARLVPKGKFKGSVSGYLPNGEIVGCVHGFLEHK